MAILVTGCAGMIGSTTARRLLDNGESVVGVDNFSDAYDRRLKQWRIDQLIDRPNFSFHTIDISDFNAMRSVFEENRASGEPSFTGVLNIGAWAGVRYSVENPWIYYQVNTTGTLCLLELCREFGVKKFVLSSTSSIYGDDAPRPFNESSHTSKPLSPYAASKKAAETLLYTYHHLHGIDATVLRYFTVYGPAGRPDMAVYRFIRLISEGLPITVYGDGSAERDFTFVEDIARGTIAALKPVGYEIINLGNDNPTKVSELISMIEDCLEKKAKIEHTPMHPADAQATWADISKARELLGWEPQTSLEQGIQRTVEWYRANEEWAREIIA